MASVALMALFALAPVSGLSGSTLHAQVTDGDDNEYDIEDEGQADDKDGDVADDDLVAVQPNAKAEAEWSDPAEGPQEKQAERVDDDNYVKNCRDTRGCQETLKYVEQQLNQMLTNYTRNSTRRRTESPPPPSVLKRGTTKYNVSTGQQLNRVSGIAGANDQLLWGQVTKVVPRPLSDRLMSSFWVFRKKTDNTLAYVQGDDGDMKFLMAINEPNHLSTNLREQFLTVSHELMHMIVMDQVFGNSGEQTGPQDAKSRKFSVDALLAVIFGTDEQGTSDETEEAATPTATCEGIPDDDGCYPIGSIYAEFVRKFWSKSDLENHSNEDFYEKNTTRFVTDYSTSSPHEDIAESFSYWVIAEGRGKTVADAKQRFFGRFPQLVALKGHIRRAVIADILKSRPAAS